MNLMNHRGCFQVKALGNDSLEAIGKTASKVHKVHRGIGRQHRFWFLKYTTPRLTFLVPFQLKNWDERQLPARNCHWAILELNGSKLPKADIEKH